MSLPEVGLGFVMLDLTCGPNGDNIEHLITILTRRFKLDIGPLPGHVNFHIGIDVSKNGLLNYGDEVELRVHGQIQIEMCSK